MYYYIFEMNYSYFLQNFLMVLYVPSQTRVSNASAPRESTLGARNPLRSQPRMARYFPRYFKRYSNKSDTDNNGGIFGSFSLKRRGGNVRAKFQLYLFRGA